jgi:hypothetical protein
MLYQFKQAVCFGGKTYSLGVNEVDEKAEQDPYFLKLVKHQYVLDVEATVVVSPETLKERSERLLERLASRKPYRSVPIDEPKADESAEPVKKDVKKSKKSKG